MGLSLPKPVGHLLDKDTLALWRLDEALASTTIVDATGVYNFPVAGAPAIVSGLISDGGRARRFTSGFYTAAGDTAMGNALRGEFTIDAWVSLDAYGSGIDTRLVDILCGTSRLIWFSINNVGRLEAVWNSSSDNTVSQQYDDTTTTLSLATRYHIAMRKVSLGGNYRIDFFVNGVKISSSGSLPNTGALGAPTIANLGSGNGGAPFLGIADDVRISKVARTDAEIFDSYRRGAVGLGPDSVSPLSKVTDHAARAATALIEQYKDKPRIAGLLAAFANQVQKAEDGLWPAVSELNLQCASGMQLDLLGKVVGEPRNGRSDVSYRSMIQAKIILNLSSGTIEEIYTLFLLIMGVHGISATVQLVEFFPKAFALRLFGALGQVVPSDLFTILQRVKDAGARAWLEYSLSAPANTFTLDIGPGLDQGALAGQLPLG